VLQSLTVRVFPQVFREEVPELVDADPKLLFKLCTMITPKVSAMPPHFTI